MASYRPFPPQTSFAPAPIQNPLPPPQPQPPPPLHPPHQRAQYNQNWGGYGGGGGAAAADGSISSAPPPPSSSYPQNYNTSQMHPNSNYHHQHYVPPRGQQPPPPPPHQQYPYPPPPPPPESSYPPPPPPPAPSMAQNSMNVQPPQAPIYYPSNQYSQYSHPPIQPMRPPPPPPPPSSPPSSSIPPPPPPSSPPPPPSAPLQNKVGGVDRGSHERDKGSSKELTASGRHGLLNLVVPAKQQQKPPVPPVPVKKSNGPPGRVETDEERRLRKKREFEKQKQEEKQRQQLKESQNTVLQKTQMLSSAKVHGSIVGSRMGDRRATPLLSGERVENRLKKPTTFLCKLKFRNELPDPSAQPKLMAMKNEKDQYTKYTITSLEKTYKPKLFVEPDLGIPLDLLDLSVYNPPSARPPLAPEDEELLHDDVAVTPVKNNGIRRKERPTDKGVAWLVKTQYISPLSMESTKQSLTEKQAKDLREMKGGRNILENLNNRERQIKEIESSFVACKSHPVHATNKDLYPLEVLPLLPDFDRYDDQFVVAAFDSAPTADAEVHGKLDQTVRDAYESQAIMKSYMATGSDTDKSFLAYMVPSPDELSKNIYDEREDISYSWVREYHYDFRLDDVDDPTTYLVSFDEAEARYVPLPTKLVLRKKRAKEGRSSDEVEYFPVPSRVTVRRRSAVAAVELRDSEVYSNSKGSFSNSKRGGLDIEDGLGRPQKVARHQDIDQSSGAEDEISD
ncbi:protein PAF1 homolog [Juglans microcarpa x Juglans regia]|uniref:protein PAF1 homolog n=1 Tax=Juglans microcarpa x Juglans regia TaxID=2249226 RepID=UPI001B7E0945|nr:protein PAF1 homolog [Juglans microcarpa x Juglans regia]